MPLGPCFVQDPENFQENNWFVEQFIEQLSKAEIVVVNDLRTPIINEYVEKVLTTEFSEIPWTICNIEKPDIFQYTVLYRNK